MTDVGRILDERQTTHGDYGEHAECTQHTSALWSRYRNWSSLSVEQRETLHMIAHKVGRILTGNPDVPDHWDDIAGYSTLVSRRLRETFMGTHQDALRYALTLTADPQSMSEFLQSWESGTLTMKEWPDYAHLIRTGSLREPSSGDTGGEVLYSEVDRLIREMHTPGTPEDGGHHEPRGELSSPHADVQQSQA